MMETNDMKTMTIEQFTQLLDIYGSDISRWPTEKAAAADALLGTSEGAKAKLSEARQLDEMLTGHLSDVASTNQIDLSALEDRILSAALKDHTHTAESAKVIDHPAKSASESVAQSAVSKLQSPANDNWVSNLAASGLLAASLLIGLYFGAMGGASTFLNTGQELTLASLPFSGDILELGEDYNLDIVEETGN